MLLPYKGQYFSLHYGTSYFLDFVSRDNDVDRDPQMSPTSLIVNIVTIIKIK
jgi:hypothetical protein